MKLKIIFLIIFLISCFSPISIKSNELDNFCIWPESQKEITQDIKLKRIFLEIRQRFDENKEEHKRLNKKIEALEKELTKIHREIGKLKGK